MYATAEQQGNQGDQDVEDEEEVEEVEDESEENLEPEDGVEEVEDEEETSSSVGSENQDEEILQQQEAQRKEVGTYFLIYNLYLLCSNQKEIFLPTCFVFFRPHIYFL